MAIPERPGASPAPNVSAALYARPILWGALFVAVYLISRLYAAIHIPIFIDEAIHIDWARATRESIPPSDANFDGKWLSIKLFSLAVRLLIPRDDLTATRLVTVALGLTAALACYLLARDLFSRRTGALSVALYLVLPFTVIYNSLALADGIQMAFGAWATLLSVRLARSSHWGYVVALPLFLAAAILAKFSGLILITLPVLAILLLTPRSHWAGAALRALPALLTPLGLLALFYSRGMLLVFQWKAIGNSAAPGEKVWANLMLAGSWLWGLLTPSIAVLAGVAVGWLLLRERSRAGLFVVALLCVAVLPYVLISDAWYPRYLLPAIIPVALAIGQLLVGAIRLAQKRWHVPRAHATALSSLVVIGMLGWPTLRSGVALFDLPQADLPEMERFQLVTGWPAGYGVHELVTFLQEQSAATPEGIIIARLHWVDHLLQSLNIYLTPSPVISLYTIRDKDTARVATLARLSGRQRTLLVIGTEHGAPQRLPEEAAPLLECSTVIWSYTRPGGVTGLEVRELACGESAIATATR